jgi:hypothetical protein
MSATKTSALDQLLLDLFNTALEGGINYWSVCNVYHWCVDGNPEVEDVRGFYAEIIEDEDGTAHRIDREVMAKGYRLATTDWKHRISWSSGEDPKLVVGPETDWDFDADDADAIVQLGLFGEVVYG